MTARPNEVSLSAMEYVLLAAANLACTLRRPPEEAGEAMRALAADVVTRYVEESAPPALTRSAFVGREDAPQRTLDGVYDFLCAPTLAFFFTKTDREAPDSVRPARLTRSGRSASSSGSPTSSAARRRWAPAPATARCSRSSTSRS